MAKLLKLQGCGSYVSPRINNQHVRKGQVIRVPDSTADKLLEGFEKDRENNEIRHFVVVPDDTPLDFDFVLTPEQKAATPKHVIEEAGEEVQETESKEPAEEAPVESKSVQKRVAVQRKPRSAAVKK